MTTKFPIQVLNLS